MSDIPDDNWSERDDRNAENAPDGFPPGLPAQIETIGRMMMGAIKRFWNKSNPAYQTSGTGDDYVVTPEGKTVFIHLYEIVRVRVNRANTTTTPTFKFGDTNPRIIKKAGPSGIVALLPGDMLAGQDHSLWYDGTNYILSNPATVDSASVVGVLKTANNLSELTATAGTARGNIGAAPLASPTFTGTVTIPAGANISGYALLASPAFTGNPTAPTQTAGNNSTRLATTAYADRMMPLAGGTFTGAVNFGGFASTNMVLTSPTINSPTENSPTINTPTGYLISGLLFGLTISNSVVDATNDIQVDIGVAASDATPPTLMRLNAALIKQTDAAWAAGNNAGGWLDGASMPNGTGHVFVIYGSSGVDVGISANLSPTLPAGYNSGKRRIGSIIRVAGALVAFTQRGDHFDYVNPPTERSSTAAQASTLLPLGVPFGVVTQPKIATIQQQSGAGNVQTLFASAGGQLATYASTTAAGEVDTAVVSGGIFTNTSSQIQFAVQILSGSLSVNTLITRGWIDPRGQI